MFGGAPNMAREGEMEQQWAGPQRCGLCAPQAFWNPVELHVCGRRVSGKAESPLTRRWGRRDEGIGGGGGYLKRPALLVVDGPSSN